MPIPEGTVSCDHPAFSLAVLLSRIASSSVPITATTSAKNVGPRTQISLACVRGRMNVIVSGGAGTGKTTMLGILSAFIPDDER